MNPLVESCLVIAKCGYTSETKVSVPYFSDKLFALGTYLLKKRLVPSEPSSRPSKRLVICFGSGIDSYCALFKALEEKSWENICLLHLNYGQPYFHEERKVFDKIVSERRDGKDDFPNFQDLSPMAQDFRKVQDNHNLEFAYRTETLIPCEMKDLGWENYIIPARNLVIASLAAELGNTVWIVANHRTDESVGARDKTTKFYNLASQICSEFYGRKIVVESPVLHLSKLQMVQEHLAKGYNVQSLLQTFSCYNPRPDQTSERHCGTCYACFKRYKLFQALNVEHVFRAHPADGPNWLKYQEAENKKRGEKKEEQDAT